MHNTVDQTFWILYLLCVFGFLTQSKVKNDKEESMNDKIFHCVWLKVFDEEFQLDYMTSFIKKV